MSTRRNKNIKDFKIKLEYYDEYPGVDYDKPFISLDSVTDKQIREENRLINLNPRNNEIND